MPEIAGRFQIRSRAPRQFAARTYRRCVRPFGLHALDRMLVSGLPAELGPALEVLLGRPPPREAAALVDKLERQRAELGRRSDVYRYVYHRSTAGTVRWPDDATHAAGEAVSLSWLASAASVPARWGLVLHMCADAISARTVLELGAGAGMSGAYLAAGTQIELFVTIEGSPPLARIAAETIATVTDRATVVQGSFEAELPRTLAALHDDGRSIDLAYIDGHHDEVATIEYLRALRPHLRRGSIVVLDDIYLWRGMSLAWWRACSLPGVSAAIDTGRFGILVWDEDAVASARRFVLRRFTGRWRVGPPRPQPSALDRCGARAR